MSYLLVTTLFIVGLALAVRPLLARREVAWPVEAPDARDDMARAVSSLRDLEFARAAGDRAPGEPITGTAPVAPTLPELEARAKTSPRDVPTLLALADAYVAEDRVTDAVATYQAVLAIDKDSVPALNGIGFMLFRSGEMNGARIAADRVLALRPRDADALFLKGLIQYRSEDWRGAVDTWTVFLDVGEFHPAAEMVRPLYQDARKKAGL